MIRRSIGNIMRKKQTYFHFMWQSVYIYYNGDVYVCCHNKPAKIGNIYLQDLHDIWINSKILKRFRLMSRLNCLECFDNCNLISQSQKNSKLIHNIYPDYPNIVWVNCGEFCNIKCIMCPQDHRSKVMLDSEVLKKNIDWEQVQDILLQGGEILAMKSGKELFLFLTQRLHKKVDIITNGILIDDTWAEYLVRGCNWIVISVNAATKPIHEKVNLGSNFNTVITNIAKLISYKKLYGLNVKIKFKFTIVPDNIMEIADAIVLSNEIGCDQIEFGYDPCVLSYLRENNDLKQELAQKIESTINRNKLSDFVDVSRLQYLGLLP